MIRLLMVDDHTETRAKTINSLTAGGLISVIAEAETSDQALKLGEKLLPDIVLLDLHLPGLLNSIDLIKRLTALRNVKVIAFASQVLGVDVHDTLEAGACGYILKSDPSALIRMSILMVSRGSRGITSPAVPFVLTRLTRAERTLLNEITQRGGIAKAAARMHLSEESLQETLTELSDKLELTGPDKLFKWAKKHGF